MTVISLIFDKGHKDVIFTKLDLRIHFYLLT
jgi:hypothetical protein